MQAFIPDTVGPFNDLQTLFNYCFEWAQTHKRCVSAGGSCYYRNRDKQYPNACLIGAAIPDSKLGLYYMYYTIGIVPLMENVPAIAEHFKGIEPIVLEKLQQCHDCAFSEADTIQNLQDFAVKYNLTVPNLIKINEDVKA